MISLIHVVQHLGINIPKCCRFHDIKMLLGVKAHVVFLVRNTQALLG